MTAESDSSTIVNFARHSYFTLNDGHAIRDHLLQIDADHYTPTDPELIPTPYDINFVLRRVQAGLHRAARLLPPHRGIAMEV